ncbi:hypothetical protein [Kibdelosporangium aridum]|uniref:hypothetical protein n=1 Tax=Kibdelosporangium aridum TaxID=2030 RepID=UPI0035F0D226
MPGTPVRGVTDTQVIAGSFRRIDEGRRDPRVRIAERVYLADRFRAASVLDEPVELVVTPLPLPGVLAQRTGVAESWLARVACPPADLAMIGTAAWLREDLSACVGSPVDSRCATVPLASYVLPEGTGVATWSTRIMSAFRLADHLPIPRRFLGAILDGYGAIRYLNDIDVPIVVCVIDRSLCDESAAEVVMQARNANSQPVMLHDVCGWRPPAGIEALAFTVAL